MRKIFHYISPSLLPSKSANSIHVMHQCNALCDLGFDVILYAKRSIQNKNELPNKIKESYGVSSPHLKYVTYYNSVNFANVLLIALMAVKNCLLNRQDYVLSRNLYAAFILSVLFRRPLLFETHQLEYGIRKFLQRSIIGCSCVKTVAISQRLVEILAEHHRIRINTPLILHDAAPVGIEPKLTSMRRHLLSQKFKEDIFCWRQVCGYFGHLYTGRGIEIIEIMALELPEVLFLIYGGNDYDVLFRRQNNKLINLRFMGHINHVEAQRIMKIVDVLLMPYQHEVSIGDDNHDTARWMSPMKMFEYMASGVPIISSDLPVLREVLSNGVNCVLVESNNNEAWINALLNLMNEPKMAQRIGLTAHLDYKHRYTWSKRAKELIIAARLL